MALIASVTTIKAVASAPIDTTGATVLIAATANAFGNATLVDNKSNTWIPLTAHTADSGSSRIFYCFTPIVGTGHTFTPSGSYASVIVYAFSDVISYHLESGNGNNTPPLASGIVTPSANGALIVTTLGANNAATDSVTPGFGTVTNIPNSPGAYIQNSAAWQIQTTAAAINPTWNWTSGGHNFTNCSTAVFLSAVVVTSAAEKVSLSAALG